MARRLLIVCFILSFCTLCLGQTTRIEIKLNRIPNDMEVISLNEKGFLLLYSGGEKRGNSFNSWNITKFNTNFEEEWNKLWDIPSRFSIENYIIDSAGKRFIWISKSVTQLRLDIIDLNDGLNSTQTYGLGKRTKNIVSSKVVGDDLYLLLKYGPDEHASGCYNTCCFPIAFPLDRAGLSLFKYGSLYTRIDLKNQIKYERIDVSKGIALPDKIQAGDTTLSVSSFKRKPHSHGKTALIIKTLEKNLKTRDSIILNAPNEFYLQNVQLLSSENGYAAAGTFNRDAPEPDENLNTIEAQGFYTAIIDSNKNVSSIKLIRFSELTSFEKYIEDVNTRNNGELSENKKNRLKKRYRNYSTLIHFNEIAERENDFIATAEAFYPVYSSYRDANGNIIRYFEGYNYTHCLIICFDKNGNLKWDKTIPLNFNRLYLNLGQKVKTLQDGEDIQLSFGSGSEINVMTISGDEISEPENFKLPRLLNDDEKASEYLSDVTPWYGKKYLIWGVQKIRKSDIKEREGNNLIYMDEMEIK